MKSTDKNKYEMKKISPHHLTYFPDSHANKLIFL